MGVTDQHGNTHRPAGTPAGGQFIGRVNAAPAGALQTQVNVAAAGVRAGQNIDLQFNRDDSPFAFAFTRNRRFRDAWKTAGRPRAVRVVRIGRVPDEPSDIALTLELGEQEHTVTVHRERTVSVLT